MVPCCTHLWLLPEFASNSLEIIWVIVQVKKASAQSFCPAFSGVVAELLVPRLYANQRRFVSCLCVHCWFCGPSLCFAEHSYVAQAGLKSPTLFSHLTAKAAPVSNTSSLLSSYICSGPGCKDGSRSKKMVGQSVCPSLYSLSCPSFADHLGVLCCSVPCVMSDIE